MPTNILPTDWERAISSVVGSLVVGRLDDGIKPVLDPSGRHHAGFELAPMHGYQGRHRAAEVATA